MQEEEQFQGLVLKSAPVRDYDKRLTVLTVERGKITVWAAGAKKPGSPLMAASRSFVFGVFSVTKGRGGYNLRSVRAIDYFEEIALDLTLACYASYFLEFTDYRTDENEDCRDLLNLIYLSLKALLRPEIPDELVRRVFELRSLYLSGEYTETPPLPASAALRKCWNYVLSSDLRKIFNFTLKEETLREFGDNVDVLLRDLVPAHFKSLEMLKSLR